MYTIKHYINVSRNSRLTYSVRDCDYVGNYSFYRIDQTSGGFMTWSQGVLACQQVGGNLASIRNFQEYRIALDLTRNLREAGGFGAWIGQ